ncbi:MAG TPA: ATP-binding protein [Candidatus Didemnitutus sp.]|nr:ATP-binding protein [Candidatus Didemnitutus sp.]
MPEPIKPRDRDILIQALRTGVVPRVGQHLIQVGRVNEIDALLKNLDSIADGGTAFRLIIGEYGSGKTFFLNLIRAVGLKKRLVATSADLNPDRRLQASGGQARSLYAELAKNLSTQTKAEGGALAGIVEKFLYSATTEAKTAGTPVDAIINQKLSRLAEMVNGYDFAHVISVYCESAQGGNEQRKADAVRWLRGEFTTKTDARNALGVRTIVDDDNVYDQIKLLSIFVRLSGFSGLLICLDEMVNLYKLSNAQARNANYEQILRILNDVLQGSVEGLGFLLGGTPDFLLDTRRGLYSYAALQSRLAENAFAKDGLVDFEHPVIRLSSLTPEDFLVLLQKIQNVYAYGDPLKYPLPDLALPAFMAHCEQRIGEAYFRTPRTTITSFVNFLAVLEQNPGTKWEQLIGQVAIDKDSGGQADLVVEGAPGKSATDDGFAQFKL